MAAPTFTPPRAPKRGTSDKPKFTVLKAEFGDGYTQAGKRLNNVRRVLTIGWDDLTPTEAAAISTFIATQAGTTAFYYTPSNEATPVLWTCSDLADQRTEGGLRSITLVFEQSFNIV